MRRPDPRNDKAGWRAGEVGKAKTSASGLSVIEGGNVKLRSVPSIIASHFCNCRPGVTCVFCFGWDRRIRNIEQRMAHAGGVIMARPWYPWYPSDYARATAHLTFAEDSAYRRLLDHYYSTGSLPAIADILLRVCRAFADDEKVAVLKVAAEFFREVDGFLIQDRVAEEINKSLYLSGVRSESGRKGASKSNGKLMAIGPANVVAIAETIKPAIADTTTTTSSKPSCAIPSHGKDGNADPEGFAECWAAYPKRAGGNSRKEAATAYRARIKTGVLPADLLAGVQRYAAFIRATGKEGSAFVKQAASFFGPAEHWSELWDAPLDAGHAGSEASNPFRGAI